MRVAVKNHVLPVYKKNRIASLLCILESTIRYNILSVFRPGKNRLLDMITSNVQNMKPLHIQGAQWLSGRVLDSRPKGCGVEPHRRHCVVVLEQGTFILA